MTIQTDLKDLSHRNQIGDFLNKRGLTGKGVEVGTLFGAFASVILKTWQGHLHCVDPWVNQRNDVYFDGANTHNMDDVFAAAQAEVGSHERCTMHRLMSLNGSGRFEDGELDWVYLDGNHAVDSVRADIAAWWPKVKIGGIVSGHDFFTRYDHETNSDALTAVSELAEALGIRPHVTWDTSWWFIKTKEADAAFRMACEEDRLPRPVYTYNGELGRGVIVVPVARFDWNLAVKMLTWWAKLLCGMGNPFPVVALCSPELTDSELDAIGDSGLPNLSIVVAKGVKEVGYFGTPNRIMKFALDFCEKNFESHPILWVEADAVPIHTTWAEEIFDEYRRCGRPFMGDVQRGGGIPHLTGVAVYHPEWRRLAPSLALLPGPVAECGWDSQCSHDILPRAHISKTIQQFWRPKLPITKEWAEINLHEEVALFHQCKDGSLIDVLCEESKVEKIPLAEPLCASTYDSDKLKFSNIDPQGTTLAPTKSVAKRGGVAILIVSCKRDLELLACCILSIKKYAKGFNGVILAVPIDEVRYFQKFQGDGVILTTFIEPPGKGMMMHEVMICRADEICGDVDAILHLDSDCIFWKPVTPADYMPGGKYLMVRERYEWVASRNPNRLIWGKCVERATGIIPEWETMVRHPNIYPRQLYSRLRHIVETHTGIKFNNYVLSCENGFPQGFAEFPTLGAIAINEMPERFHFVDYDHARDGRECAVPDGMTYQYLYRPERDFIAEGWSHAGFGRHRQEWQKFLNGDLPKYYVK